MDYPLIVDVSHWQDPVAPAALKAAGVMGIVHKATEIGRAGNPIDEKYAERKAACLAEGLLWGAYLYFDPGDGIKQAQFFLDTVNPDGQTLLAIDLEEAGIALPDVEACIRHIYTETGVYPWVYTGAYVIRRILGSTSELLGKCPLWIADPNNNPPIVPMPWYHWTMHQYGSGLIDGVNYDHNHFNGSTEQLKEAWQMASPNIAGLTSAQVKGTNFVPAFKSPGGELHSWLTAGDTIPLLENSQQTVDGVAYLETPDDRWLRQDNLTVNTPPPAPTASVRYVNVGDSLLNVRAAPTLSSQVLRQLKTGQRVEVFLPAQSTSPFFTQLSTVDGVSATGWVSNTYLSVTNPKA